MKPKKSLLRDNLSYVFSEDYDVVGRKILDPRGLQLNRWNKCFLVACFVSLFVDPIFFFLTRVEENMCMDESSSLRVALTIIRTVVDMLYMIRIIVQFRTAYIAPSSRIFGRGELVTDSVKIGSRYLRKGFWLDLLAALPLPQAMMWFTLPFFKQSEVFDSRISLLSVVIFQFLLRFYITFLLTSQITNAVGVLVEAAWGGAFYNLMLFMLASHVIGSSWYLLAVDRLGDCWKEACHLHSSHCRYLYLDCRSINTPGRAHWFESSNISSLCGPESDFYQFGIYLDAIKSGVTTANFLRKYYYSLWWGLRSLSSLGEILDASTYVAENNFCIIIGILGLLLFALLIGNMQTYLQSTTVRVEEWRLKRTDTELWMRHRQLPHELRERVRKHALYEWATTRGVDEESILDGLPLYLRRDIKRHLCAELVRQVPLFDQMDEHMIDAICERLKPVICAPGTCLVGESDPVEEMLFIIRGRLDSTTTDGGRSGFLNSCRIGPGEFCGEELLTWALDPRTSIVLPLSTRTVTAVTAVEAFALSSDSLKFVASQFRKMHDKKIRHTFRFHSHQWRTWAACIIQAAWFRFKRRRVAAKLNAKEGHRTFGTTTSLMDAEVEMCTATLSETLAKGRSSTSGSDLDLVNPLAKPEEPDFLVDEY